MKLYSKISIAVITLVIGVAGLSGCSSLKMAATTAPDATLPGVAQASTTSAGAPSAVVAVGSPAPEFQLKKTDGAPVSLDELRGQPVVLVFWTAWCVSCEEEAPHINKLAAEYEARGVKVLGINVNDSAQRTVSGIKDFGIRYTVARDEGAQVARRYNVTGTPTIVFIDKRGVVRYHANEIPKDYAAQLNALIEDNG